VRRSLTDKRLQKLLQKISDVDGASLLSWVDDDEVPQTLSSQQLNAYLASISGSDEVTAKVFRTWAGTVAAFECALHGSATIKQMATQAAKRLNNTPTVARSSYIHPAVISLGGQHVPEFTAVDRAGLRVSEQSLLGFLETR